MDSKIEEGDNSQKQETKIRDYLVAKYGFEADELDVMSTADLASLANKSVLASRGDAFHQLPGEQEVEFWDTEDPGVSEGESSPSADWLRRIRHQVDRRNKAATALADDSLENAEKPPKPPADYSVDPDKDVAE